MAERDYSVSKHGTMWLNVNWIFLSFGNCTKFAGISPQRTTTWYNLYNVATT